MDFSRFTTISLDCYGTLIDWEAGMLPILRALLTRHKCNLADPAILELYGEFEANAESGPYRTYREVLESVVWAFGERLGFQPSPSEVLALPESVPSWPPFSDTVAALRALKKRYRLAVARQQTARVDIYQLQHLGIELELQRHREHVMRVR